MNAGTTVCFYLLLGFGVAIALWLGNDSKSGASGFFQMISAPLFWPIYIPVLLARRTPSFESVAPALGTFPPERETDVMGSLIAQVESELDAALHGLSGWAENALLGEQHRIAELKNAWCLQARRIRELDKLLNQPATEAQVPMRQNLCAIQSDASSQTPATGSAPSNEIHEIANEIPFRVVERERSRSENIGKLKEVRRQMYDDLMSSLAWVRELVTMIHLAKFTGAPASQALDLVRQIADAVTALSNTSRTAMPRPTE